MKGKILKERGITLIALVITIIVLLILAGVTISIVLHTGIIDNSQKAVDQYAYEQQREEEALKSLSGYLHSYYNTVPIYTAEELKQIGTGNKFKVENDKTEYDFNIDANYVLMNDIDLNPNKWSKNDDGDIIFTSDAAQWTPIGTEDVPFKGTFNGNGHIISGIYINKPEEDNQGLFGVIEDSTIENLTVSGSITGNSDLGGIACATKGKTTINNCHNLCTIIGKITIGGVTGIISNGNVIISNCSNKGNLSSSDGWANLGGIVGTTTTELISNREITITHCYNEGELKSSGIATGGIIGECYAYNTSKEIIEYCYNSGKIISTGDRGTGGILGYRSDRTANSIMLEIKSCYNTGKIEGKNCIGGITGRSFNAHITNSYNTGEIIMSETKADVNNVGGIVGSYGANAKGSIGTTISNCYNTGRVHDKDNNLLNGILGEVIYDWSYVTLTNCYYLQGNAEGENNDEKITGTTDPKTKEDMTSPTFVETLNNGENNWKEDTGKINEGYPILSWQ